MTDGGDGTPLEGIKVIDLTRLAPGPYATMLLGDLGASIVTIEPPTSRREGSSAAALPGYGTERSRRSGLNPLFRSRRSIVIDLKTDEGKAVLLELAREADVFVEGFRPGVVHRLGIDYASLRDISPEIVYCSISGYGQEDDRRHRSGHDLTYLAESGLLSATTRDGSKPAIPFNVAGDLAAGGLMAAFGILAALQGRERTGRGSFVDISIFHGLLSLLAPTAAWERSGAGTQSWGKGMLSGAVPFYDCYRTADERWIAIAALEPKFYTRMCNALGLNNYQDAYTNPDRWPSLREALARIFSRNTLTHWVTFLAEFDFPFAPVRSVEEAFDAELGAAAETEPKQPAVFVPRLSSWQHARQPIATRPGEHTVEVLAEAGLPQAQIEKLLEQGVVRGPAIELED